MDSVSDLDEIRQRLDVLEGEVARLREDATATRTLAGMADRDASEVRGALHAHTQLLNALRETQVEQGRTLVEHGQVLGALVEGQARHSAMLNGLTTTVGSLADGQERQGEALSELTAMVRRLVERGE